MYTFSNIRYDTNGNPIYDAAYADQNDIRFRMFVSWLGEHGLSLSSFDGSDPSVIIFKVGDGIRSYAIRVSESRVLGLTCWGILDRLWAIIAALFRIKEEKQ